MASRPQRRKRRTTKSDETESLVHEPEAVLIEDASGGDSAVCKVFNSGNLFEVVVMQHLGVISFTSLASARASVTDM